MPPAPPAGGKPAIAKIPNIKTTRNIELTGPPLHRALASFICQTTTACAGTQEERTRSKRGLGAALENRKTAAIAADFP
jgi:hypothetical protein